MPPVIGRARTRTAATERVEQVKGEQAISDRSGRPEVNRYGSKVLHRRDR